MGWWLVFCLVIYTGFESELISHLTVNKARTRPPETLEDLVNADGWKWGIDSWLWTGVPLEYFTRHKDPVVVEINKFLEVRTQIHKSILRCDGLFSVNSCYYTISYIIKCHQMLKNYKL